MDAGRSPEGRRRQLTRSAFATRKDAQAALDEELARQDAGLADLRALTVGQYLQDWLAGKRRLRQTTRRNYAGHLERYLLPALGQHRLADLRPAHIDRLYDDLLSGHWARTSPATVLQVHRTLRSALNTAVKRRLIAWNPALHVELPEHHRPRTTVWTPADLRTFLASTSQHRLHALFHVVAFTGLRRGEALGLHWDDVDLDQLVLAVLWGVTDVGHGPRLNPPKTAAGRRFVPLDAVTVQVLRDHRARQVRERSTWGAAWQEHGLVFTREDGSLLRPDYITKLFDKLVARAGVPRIRLHDLRHTHASLALAAGVDIKVVSDRLGHATTSITSDLYTHVVPAVARRAADAIAAAVPLVAPEGATDVSDVLARRTSSERGRAPPSDNAAGQSTE